MFLPRLSNKKWSLVFAVVSLVAAIIALTGMKSYQPTNAYILQGASKPSMISLVNNIGGKVVHDFAVIPAISALLTDDQVSTIKKTNPLIRLFSDAKVQLKAKSDTWHNAKPIKFKVENNKAIWVAKNRTDEDAEVESISIDWPAENGDLKKLKVNGDVVAKKVTGQHLTYYFDEAVEVESGDKLKMVMKFDELNNVNDQDFSISFNLVDGTTIAMQSVNQSIERGEDRDTYFPTQVNADKLHQVGITGKGVGVAIIDSGLGDFDQIEYNTYGEERNIHRVSVTDVEVDDFGHGSHVTSLIANSSATYDESGQMTLAYNGIAPDVDLISVKAFDETGIASYADILLAIDYVLVNKDELNIKVLNLSFGSEVETLYNVDPINVALMKAWQEGITVVASAGNTGPDALTVGVPGNNPFIITVGATSDNYTPFNMNDDFIATFSSSGPTYEGFIKPEILAPGAHMQGLVSEDSYLMQNYGMYDDNEGYFLMSGTSQATAITTGVVALMLQEQPDLTPDDIKCRLMTTGRLLKSSEEELAYSIFRQGAGLIDAYGAVFNDAANCSNFGLDVDVQLENLDAYYLGPVRWNNQTQEFYLEFNEDYTWDGNTDQNLIDELISAEGLILDPETGYPKEKKKKESTGLILDPETGYPKEKPKKTNGLILDPETGYPKEKPKKTNGLILDPETGYPKEKKKKTNGLILDPETGYPRNKVKTQGLILDPETGYPKERKKVKTNGLILDPETGYPKEKKVKTNWVEQI